jgi:K+-transporting ATPase KdpF subunit
LASRNVLRGIGSFRLDACLHQSLRQSLKGTDMNILTLLTAFVALLLLIYLFAALVRPEWF